MAHQTYFYNVVFFTESMTRVGIQYDNKDILFLSKNIFTITVKKIYNIHKSSRVGVQLRVAAVKTRCAYSTHYYIPPTVHTFSIIILWHYIVYRVTRRRYSDESLFVTFTRLTCLDVVVCDKCDDNISQSYKLLTR